MKKNILILSLLITNPCSGMQILDQSKLPLMQTNLTTALSTAMARTSCAPIDTSGMNPALKKLLQSPAIIQTIDQSKIKNSSLPLETQSLADQLRIAMSPHAHAHMHAQNLLATLEKDSDNLAAKIKRHRTALSIVGGAALLGTGYWFYSTDPFYLFSEAVYFSKATAKSRFIDGGLITGPLLLQAIPAVLKVGGSIAAPALKPLGLFIASGIAWKQVDRWIYGSMRKQHKAILKEMKQHHHDEMQKMYNKFTKKLATTEKNTTSIADTARQNSVHALQEMTDFQHTYDQNFTKLIDMVKTRDTELAGFIETEVKTQRKLVSKYLQEINKGEIDKAASTLTTIEIRSKEGIMLTSDRVDDDLPTTSGTHKKKKWWRFGKN